MATSSPDEPVDHAEAFEKALSEAAARSGGEHYALRLFVTGNTPRSSKAVKNIQALCEKHLAGRYDLEVVDIIQQPELARSSDLIAAPTLIKRKPEPTRKVIGDFSDTDKVLLGLDIRPVKTPVPESGPQ